MKKSRVNKYEDKSSTKAGAQELLMVKGIV